MNTPTPGKTWPDILHERPFLLYGIFILLVGILALLIYIVMHGGSVSKDGIVMPHLDTAQAKAAVLPAIDSPPIAKSKQRSIPKGSVVTTPQKQNPISSKPKSDSGNVAIVSGQSNIVQQGNGDKQVNTNNGTNFGNIGGSNNQVTNIGDLPRILPPNFMDPFVKAFPRLDTRIAFRFFGSPNSEMLNVKQQMIVILTNKGYNNIGNGNSIETSSERPSFSWVLQRDSSVYITIPPK